MKMPVQSNSQCMPYRGHSRTGLLLCTPIVFALVMASACVFVGCASPDAELKGRVAVNVSVELAGSPVADGILILRPDPGVQCPMIRIPVEGGEGALPEMDGPLPGTYTATYRIAAADITEQLSAESSRQTPESAGRLATAPKRNQQTVIGPQASVKVTVPDENPAQVTVSFPK